MAGGQKFLASQIAGDSKHERSFNLGKKKENDKRISFYLLLASGMHRSIRNLAENNVAAVVCSRETMMVVICFVGKLLEPTGIHGGHAWWMRSGTARRVRWQGSSHGEHDKGKKTAAGKKSGWETIERRMYFYTQKSLVYQLLRDGELE